MKIGPIVLKTKLTPPPLKNHMLSRLAVTKRLKRIAQYPLTLVHCGPGFGKSSVLSAFFQSEQYSSGWYSVDSNDDDLYSFLVYMIQSLQGIHPGFCQELMKIQPNVKLYDWNDECYQLCDAFINELSMLPSKVFLVIDNYQLVEHSDSINQFMQYLLRHLPMGFFLILSTRTRPNWDQLISMKARDELLEINEADLAFTEEEIEVLFMDAYGYQLKPEEARQIFVRTEGWVIAMRLIWQQLILANGNLHTVLNNHTGMMEDLFRFLAIEVFRKQSSEVQQFLEKTSILNELNGQLCDHIFGFIHSHQMLEKLSSQGLFVVHVAEGQFRYHALFKHFLLNELTKNSACFQECHSKAASYFEQHKQNEKAVYHLESAGDMEGAARILHVYGAHMINQGQLEGLLDKIRRVPDSIKDKFYKLWIYEGEIHRYRCSYEKAISCHIRGGSLAEAAGDLMGLSMGKEGQARIYLDTIQPAKAEHLLTQSIRIVEDGDNEPEHNHLIRLFSLMTENFVNLGNAADAELWYDRCRSLATDFQEELLEARLHLRTGRLKQAKNIVEMSEKFVDHQDEKQLSLSHRERDVLLSLIEAMLGNPERTKKLAESGMMKGILMKAPFVEACGWIRMGHAAQMLPKYDFSIALNCYQTALDIMDRIKIPRGKAEALMGLCLIFGHEGSYELAVQYGNKAFRETEQAKDEWLSAFIRVSMGIASYYANRADEANAIFTECHESFMKCGDSYGATIALLWQAMLAYQQKKDEEFDVSMERFLKMLQMGEYEFLVHKRTLFGPLDVQQIAPLLIEAQKKKIQSHYVSYLLTGLGLDQLNHHPGYTLRIETLGGFRVWLGEKELTEKDWQRGKAKDLFQLLVIRRRNLVPKDEIMSILFGDLDEKLANRDFKVVLNALNTALEPDRRARSASFFIQRHGSSYGLNLAAGIELDAIEFETWVKGGLEERSDENACSMLEKGLQIYKGDYMPDRRYEDWFTEERERLQVLYLRAAERMATLCFEAGDYDRSIHWCEQMMEKDAYWEVSYRLLMNCHYKQNNRNQAIKWYQKCCKAMKEELSVEPMPATKQLYELIMHSM